MKKILVPTDLTDIAELGLKLAVEIAKRCDASISLINFTRHPLGKTFTSTGEVDLSADEEENIFTLELLQSKKEHLEGLAVKYASANVPIEFAVIDDKFRTGLDAYLSQENIDLVVMGTSGEETVKEAFIGNHTQQVIRISPCPVLSVRDGFSIDDFANIVAAVEVITDNQVAHGLAQLKTIAECFDSHIHLVHVRDRVKDANLILNEYFTKMATIAGLQKFSVVILDADDPSEGVVSYAESIHAGLIAVLKSVPDGIFRIFSNRFSNRLIKEEGRPVFTLNLQNN
ncbi:universal stress protein [Fulvivirgaceae bacterium PWU4]|uniref:Universal stress protein n=1 Tax=Chryseosolibacter histidini TaxID=2782349 RepID=A0AAP2GMD6_9BACT|nr:universal stress protein [Chryseosolibacter histidini]MBT1701421.1 universal stress protein [Chryseosolibacter histidini]